MDRFKKDTETQTGKCNYTYSYTKKQNWVVCPQCEKRLFEVLKGKDFAIEIKCRSCKRVVLIEQ
ncbi:hypothetical protein D0T66_06785 [Dysgonomonas sp. 25]|nr:hypothetical protein [Dysgonomonas sp. 25]